MCIFKLEAMPLWAKYLLTVILGFVFSMSGAQENKEFSVLITGNANGTQMNENVLDQWRKILQNRENQAILFAGNAVHPENGKIAENWMPEAKIPILIAPGKSEWAGGRRSGKQFLKELNNRLERDYANPILFPNKACPGPREVLLDENTVVILLDTWWWVHQHDRRFKKCGIESRNDVVVEIEDAIRRHYNKRHVIVVGYHNLKSFGNSAGFFSHKQWLLQFPYSLFRKLAGVRSDPHHPDFRYFRNALLSVLSEYPDVIYVSGGEQNMQYFSFQGNHFVISGAWEGQEFVRPEEEAFTAVVQGFSQLTFTSNGRCALSFYSPYGSIFHKVLYEKEFEKYEISMHDSLIFPDSIQAFASQNYGIPQATANWLGENYRAVWEWPVKHVVFNIDKEKGGLKIIRRGGGQQTYALRLADKDGREYVLRSIDKFVKGALPEMLQETFAMDLVQDQISASNPYAAPVVASLSEYAGILHTNPKIVYIPDDPRFGIYRYDVAEQLFLFEERPDGDRSDVHSFGHSKHIISTSKVIEKTTANWKHKVDVKAVLRARLFDILINDWDRHEDQWRWAGFEYEGTLVYKPIPRDRDQAFFVNEGILPWIASRKWLLPKIQGFDEFTENVDGLSYNARWFDRYFLTSVDWNDWLAEIDSLRLLLTPQKINRAMQAFPKEVLGDCGDKTARILNARRENLETMARQLYLSLAEEVVIPGTMLSDHFVISALSDTSLQVSVFSSSCRNDQECLVYKRTFLTSETRRIHLYGLEGDDHFELRGNHLLKLNLSIVGGPGKDTIYAEENLNPRWISIYDANDTRIMQDLSVKLKSSYREDALSYDREYFKYDVTYPSVSTGYNPDDGIFIGGGAIIHKYQRYRQEKYEFIGKYAPESGVFDLRLNMQRRFPLRSTEVKFSTNYQSPGYAGNFFGWGNETQWEVSRSQKEFYRFRSQQLHTTLSIVKSLSDLHTIESSVLFGYREVERTAGQFISLDDNGLNQNDFGAHPNAGLSVRYTLHSVPEDNEKAENRFAGSAVFPGRGHKLMTSIGYFNQLDASSQAYLRMKVDWVSFLRFSQRPRIVYVLRAGGEKLNGDYPFYEAARLGGRDKLLGFRESRFHGNASTYINTEMRVRMKQFRAYLFNGTAGLTLFYDMGRVWYKYEDSKKWHRGYGAGIWYSPFDLAVMNVLYAVSRDDRMLNLSLNYRF